MELTMLRNTYVYDQDKQWLFDKSHEIFRNALNASIFLSSVTKKDSFLVNGYQFLEKSKAYGLLELYRKMDARKQTNFPDSLVSQINDLKIEMQTLKKQLLQQQLSGNDLAEHTTKLLVVKKQFEQLTSHIQQVYPDYYTYLTEATNEHFSQPNRSLFDDKNLVVEYVFAASQLHLFMMNQKQFNVHSIQVDSSLFQQLAELRSEMNTAAFIDHPKDAFNRFTSAAHELYTKLMAPVENYIDSLAAAHRKPHHYTR